MNIRKHVLTGALAFGLLGSVIAPTALAQDTAGVEVVVVESGAFAVTICDPDASWDQSMPVDFPGNIPLTGTSPTASQPGSATGTFAICYLDTKNFRDAFVTQLSATDFALVGDPSTTISSENFTIEFTMGVGQAQLDSPGIDVGDIGYFVNQQDPGGQAAPPAGGTWTMDNELDQNVDVHFGYAGVGTIMSGGIVDVQLVLPIGTKAGTYESTITLTVIPD
jgi:hypothetical protein